MESERYDIDRSADSFSYEFYSEGPRGRIKKAIIFRPFRRIGRNVYNLAFGDLNELYGHIDDRTISNNGDRLKILHTIAAAVIDFVKFRPDAIILVRGSTLSRVRLYQMAMSSFWSEISQQFEIWGKLEEEWLPFEKGVNYEEFLIFKKIE